MAESDGGLRPMFRDRLRKGFHWQAVETGLITAGVPDSNVAASGGIESWIEYKQTSGWKPAIRTEQIGWVKHRRLLGCRVFLAIRRHHGGGPRKGPAVDELWMADGKYIGQVAQTGMRDPDISWLGVWSGGPSRWDWEQVEHILRSPL